MQTKILPDILYEITGFSGERDEFLPRLTKTLSDQKFHPTNVCPTRYTFGHVENALVPLGTYQ